MIPALLLLLQATATPVFQSELWPGEGRPVFDTPSGNVALRQFPSDGAVIITTLVLKPGTRLTFDSTSYQTLRPGKLRSKTEVRLAVRDFGDVSAVSRQRYYSPIPFQEVVLPAGAQGDYLQYRAEGNCFIRLEKRVLEAEQCPNSDDRLELLAQPDIRWWIRITGEGGAVGWALVDGQSVREADREF